MTLLALLSKVMEYCYLKKAKAQAKRYHARIARVITTGKNGATKYYLYEFMDELGLKVRGACHVSGTAGKCGKCAGYGWRKSRYLV